MDYVGTANMQKLNSDQLDRVLGFCDKNKIVLDNLQNVNLSAAGSSDHSGLVGYTCKSKTYHFNMNVAIAVC